MSEAEALNQDVQAPPRGSIWSGLSGEHRRYIFWQAIFGAAIVNLVLNAGIAWLSVQGEDSVPRWAVPILDRPSTITDTVGTFFILPLLTTLIFTTLARRDIRHGKVESLGWTRASHPFLSRLPVPTLRRGLMLGAITTALLAPPAVLAIVAIGVGDLSVGEFVTYKAVFGIVLGLVVTPIVALWALAEAPAPESAA
jgi:hypothetical protein